MNSRAVVGPLFIFQFAASTGRFIVNPCRRGLRRPGVVCLRDTQVMLHHRSRHGSSAPSGLPLIPPPPSRRRHCLRDRPRASIKRWRFENSHRPIHRTVSADAIAREYDSAVFGPMSSIASFGPIASFATARADFADSIPWATIAPPTSSASTLVSRDWMTSILPKGRGRARLRRALPPCRWG